MAFLIPVPLLVREITFLAAERMGFLGKYRDSGYGERWKISVKEGYVEFAIRAVIIGVDQKSIYC
jgi:hypothetical protein